MAEPISLNVGGVRYTTSMSTLTRYPDSMLGRMFGGDLPTAMDKDGAYFIDRDGQLFRFVLNFLRCDELGLPEDFKELDLLKKEVDFYQISAMMEALELTSRATDGKIVEIKDSYPPPETDHQGRKCIYDYRLNFKAPVQFFNCISFPPDALRVIENLGRTSSSSFYHENHEYHMYMLSLGDGFVSVSVDCEHDQQNPRTTRTALADLLQANGCRLLNSSTSTFGGDGSYVDTTIDRWFVPNSFLDKRWSPFK